MKSLHEAAVAACKTNNWPFAYALGYVSGLDDAAAERRPEHSGRETDDYALGYVKGYTSHPSCVQSAAALRTLRNRTLARADQLSLA